MDQDSNLLQKNHRYGTRQKSMLNLPHVFNKKYRSSFLCKALKEIQLLLSITKESNNIAQFIRLYKNKLFANWLSLLLVITLLVFPSITFPCMFRSIGDNHD